MRILPGAVFSRSRVSTPSPSLCTFFIYRSRKDMYMSKWRVVTRSRSAQVQVSAVRSANSGISLCRK